MGAEKYPLSTSFVSAAVSRGAMRALLTPLVRWPTAEPTADGYTIVVACSSSLPQILVANLRLLSRQDLHHAREILLVFDCTAGHLPSGFKEEVSRDFPHLPLRWIFYNSRQSLIADRIGWGWAYAWMSWALGIGAAETRYVFLHDYDALILQENVIEERYREIQRRNIEYLGTAYYRGNGLEPGDRLVTTFELMMDAAFVRSRFHPIDLFNRVTTFRGRRVEFDTILYAQSRGGRTEAIPIPLTAMVHPSQMICQSVDLLRRPHRIPWHANNLPMVPYYAYISGSSDPLLRLTRSMESGAAATLWNRRLRISELRATHATWIVEQIRHVELALYRRVRPEVARYCNALVTATGQGARAEPADPQPALAGLAEV